MWLRTSLLRNVGCFATGDEGCLLGHIPVHLLSFPSPIASLVLPFTSSAFLHCLTFILFIYFQLLFLFIAALLLWLPLSFPPFIPPFDDSLREEVVIPAHTLMIDKVLSTRCSYRATALQQISLHYTLIWIRMTLRWIYTHGPYKTFKQGWSKLHSNFLSVETKC